MEIDYITLCAWNKKAETLPFKADQRQGEESVTKTEKELLRGQKKMKKKRSSVLKAKGLVFLERWRPKVN